MSFFFKKQSTGQVQLPLVTVIDGSVPLWCSTFTMKQKMAVYFSPVCCNATILLLFC